MLTTHELTGRRRPLRRLTPTMSCLLLYLGCDRRFERLLHHTLLVGHDYRRFIRDVTRDGRLPSSFSTYVHAPTRTEPAMAPAGEDSIAVLLPVPNLRSGIDWERAGDGLRDALVADLEATFGLGGLGASVARRAPHDAAGLPATSSARHTATRSRWSPRSSSRRRCASPTATARCAACTTWAAAPIPARASRACCSVRRSRPALMAADLPAPRRPIAHA